MSNGITIVHKKIPSKSVSVEIMVKTGSNYEPLDVAGISHFIEHMLFEGTKKRPNSRLITNEIEKLGGEFNAYTTGDRTAYYIKVLNKHFDNALDVISDISTNSVFDEKTMEKEKKVVLKEIHMVMDDPRFYQWVLFEKKLFKKHPARNPTYGSVKAVKALTRKKILGYYREYYNPNNMIIAIVGDVDNVKEKCEKYFSGIKKTSPKKIPVFSEPPNSRKEKFVEKRKTLSAYMVLGYKIPSRLHDDAYVLDVITAILGKGQSGKIFDEIRNKRGLAYEVSVRCDTNFDHGMFAVQCSINKENIELATNLIIEEFRKLNNISDVELEEAKGFIEGSYLIQSEDTFKLADEVSFWEFIGDSSLAENYIDKIKKVTKEDVARATSKYLNENYTMIVIEPK